MVNLQHIDTQWKVYTPNSRGSNFKRFHRARSKSVFRQPCANRALRTVPSVHGVPSVCQRCVPTVHQPCVECATVFYHIADFI